jgi:hypothetical protein
MKSMKNTKGIIDQEGGAAVSRGPSSEHSKSGSKAGSVREHTDLDQVATGGENNEPARHSVFFSQNLDESEAQSLDTDISNLNRSSLNQDIGVGGHGVGTARTTSHMAKNSGSGRQICSQKDFCSDSHTESNTESCPKHTDHRNFGISTKGKINDMAHRFPSNPVHGDLVPNDIDTEQKSTACKDGHHCKHRDCDHGWISVKRRKSCCAQTKRTGDELYPHDSGITKGCVVRGSVGECKMGLTCDSVAPLDGSCVVLAGNSYRLLATVDDEVCGTNDVEEHGCVSHTGSECFFIIVNQTCSKEEISPAKGEEKVIGGIDRVSD